MNFYTKRIITFIDILGFKSKVNQSQLSEDEANKIHNGLKRIHQVKLDNYSNGIRNMNELGVEVTTFSDSAVISYPAEGDNLLYIILDLIHLQIDLALNGILIRGGLTIGELFHDRDIVYGPAMVKAYELESKIAIYPRIIVDETAVNQYFDYANGDEYDKADLESLISYDRDGMCFIEMLRQDSELNDCGTEYYSWLNSIRDIIVKGLETNDLSVRMKYQWLKGYFNSIVTDKLAYFPVPQDETTSEQIAFRRMYEKLEIS